MAQDDLIPVVKAWELNERMYGELQGLNKAETAEKYGQEQVKVWRRSYDVPPPVCVRCAFPLSSLPAYIAAYAI